MAVEPGVKEFVTRDAIKTTSSRMDYVVLQVIALLGERSRWRSALPEARFKDKFLGWPNPLSHYILCLICWRREVAEFGDCF